MKLLLEDYKSLSSSEGFSCPEKDDIKTLMEWMKQLETQEIALKQVETQFLETRNIKLLEDFQPAKDKFSTVILKQPIIEPHYLSDVIEGIINPAYPGEKEICEKGLKDLEKDVELFNHNATIEIVEKMDGTHSIAVIGVDFDEFAAFRNLRDEERRVQYEIARTRHDLDMAVINHVDIAPQSTEAIHSYIPDVVSVSPTVVEQKMAMQR